MKLGTEYLKNLERINASGQLAQSTVKALIDRAHQANQHEQAVTRVRGLREGELCSHCLTEVQDALGGEQA